MSRIKAMPRVFNTDKRIRLGIWGLGRGMGFFDSCKFLNIDVVAGCDYNENLRNNFLKCNPGAFATADADEFFKQDIDAVVLATFCPAHAEHAIRCLQEGKHVLSEVTAFFSLAEGVKLVEEVEKRKLVYNLAENYPFSADNMWLANRWKEGLFGELMYAEYEYVHELRMMGYTFPDGHPVKPGHSAHNWRSWFNYHYYCTHSLGPVMVITGTRPTKVEAFPCKQGIGGYLPIAGSDPNGSMSPSLIQMSNGSVVRNLMGAPTHDSHEQRIWGTRGAFTLGHDGVNLRLGASGQSPMMKVNTKWEGLGELAARTGHGGGDFWTLYYFAREILTGQPGPFDIYGACDVTIPGIQALRSSLEGGTPLDVPDFRIKAERARYRNDDWQQERYDLKRGVFGGAKLNEKAANFTTTMKDMVEYAPAYRAYADWKTVQASISSPEKFLPVAKQLLDCYDKLVVAYKDARAIVKAYPKTDGAQVLAEMLDVGGEKKVLASDFLPVLKKDVASLQKKFGDGVVVMEAFDGTDLLSDETPINKVGYPAKGLKFTEICYESKYYYHDIRARYGKRPADGLLYARGIKTMAKAGKRALSVGADGPFKVFVNGKEVGCNPNATNPVSSSMISVGVDWKKGKNEVMLAMRTHQGKAWGFTVKVAK